MPQAVHQQSNGMVGDIIAAVGGYVAHGNIARGRGDHIHAIVANPQPDDTLAALQLGNDEPG